jgi:hypothetical protein
VLCSLRNGVGFRMDGAYAMPVLNVVTYVVAMGCFSHASVVACG